MLAVETEETPFPRASLRILFTRWEMQLAGTPSPSTRLAQIDWLKWGKVVTKSLRNLVVIDTDFACHDNAVEELFVILGIGPVDDLLSLGHRDSWKLDHEDLGFAAMSEC